MALTKEQVSELKKQLHEQIKHLPEVQRKEAENHIESLSEEAIEEMLHDQLSQPKVFREIVSGQLSSKKVGENDVAIAVLDIKPISKGHTIVIPKDKIEHLDKIPQPIMNFSQSIAEKLSSKLKAKKVAIIPQIKFGESIINLIPIYEKDLSIESARENPSEDQLDKVLSEINKKEDPKPQKENKEKPQERPSIKKLSRRIP